MESTTTALLAVLAVTTTTTTFTSSHSHSSHSSHSHPHLNLNNAIHGHLLPQIVWQSHPASLLTPHTLADVHQSHPGLFTASATSSLLQFPSCRMVPRSEWQQEQQKNQQKTPQSKQQLRASTDLNEPHRTASPPPGSDPFETTPVKITQYPIADGVALWSLTPHHPHSPLSWSGLPCARDLARVLHTLASATTRRSSTSDNDRAVLVIAPDRSVLGAFPATALLLGAPVVGRTLTAFLDPADRATAFIDSAPLRLRVASDGSMVHYACANIRLADGWVLMVERAPTETAAMPNGVGSDQPASASHSRDDGGWQRRHQHSHHAGNLDRAVMLGPRPHLHLAPPSVSPALNEPSIEIGSQGMDPHALSSSYPTSAAEHQHGHSRPFSRRLPVLPPPPPPPQSYFAHNSNHINDDNREGYLQWRRPHSDPASSSPASIHSPRHSTAPVTNHDHHSYLEHHHHHHCQQHHMMDRRSSYLHHPFEHHQQHRHRRPQQHFIYPPHSPSSHWPHLQPHACNTDADVVDQDDDNAFSPSATAGATTGPKFVPYRTTPHHHGHTLPSQADHRRQTWPHHHLPPPLPGHYGAHVRIPPPHHLSPPILTSAASARAHRPYEYHGDGTGRGTGIIMEDDGDNDDQGRAPVDGARHLHRYLQHYPHRRSDRPGLGGGGGGHGGGGGGYWSGSGSSGDRMHRAPHSSSATSSSAGGGGDWSDFRRLGVGSSTTSSSSSSCGGGAGGHGRVVPLGTWSTAAGGWVPGGGGSGFKPPPPMVQQLILPLPRPISGRKDSGGNGGRLVLPSLLRPDRILYSHQHHQRQWVGSHDGQEDERDATVVVVAESSTTRSSSSFSSPPQLPVHPPPLSPTSAGPVANNTTTAVSAVSNAGSAATTTTTTTATAAPMRAGPSTGCARCGIMESPEWRRSASGVRDLCNACGLKHYRERKHASKQVSLAALAAAANRGRSTGGANGATGQAVGPRQQQPQQKQQQRRRQRASSVSSTSSSAAVVAGGGGGWSAAAYSSDERRRERDRPQLPPSVPLHQS